MNVTIFGSASPTPGQPAYEEARRLGELLANAGHTVLTGGYMGTMEAASRGAAEAGGHVIGVTCDQIETWRHTGANQWVREKRHFPTLRERLYCLIDSCDAAIALPGGIGTLAEISAMWSQIQTNSMPPRPLILIGEGWQKSFQQIVDSQTDHIKPIHRQLLSYAPDIVSAFDLLQQKFAA